MIMERNVCLSKEQYEFIIKEIKYIYLWERVGAYKEEGPTWEGMQRIIDWMKHCEKVLLAYKDIAHSYLVMGIISGVEKMEMEDLCDWCIKENKRSLMELSEKWWFDDVYEEVAKELEES